MLTIRLLGQLEILHGTHTVILNSRPAQSLLAYMLLHAGHAHRREKLAGVLWPDSSEENAHSNLRHALWRLRKAIPDGYIEAERITIAWKTSAAYTLDVERLARPTDSETTADDLMEAVAVYQGELLSGFYEEWILLERERLRAVYEDRMQRLLDALAEEQRWREAIQWAERWIAQGGSPEPAYRVLMAAHAGLGDRSAVAAAYQRCVQALETDFGAPPSAETVALYEAIREGRGAKSEFQKTNPPPNPSPFHNLPPQTTPFIGRKAELATLADLLANPQSRLVTILGAGGMGKTRLALAAAEAAMSHFPDGVFFVPLAALESSMALATTIAEAIKLPLQDDPRSSQQQLIDYLKRRKLLLLLDNFEYLLAGVDLMAGLLRAAPGVQILVTSRERLQLSAETVFRLEGMHYPGQVGEVDGDDDVYDAVDLFVERAQRVRRDFLVQADERQAIAHICQMVGGMPLGIVLAAGWVDLLSPRQIAAELAQNLDLLETDLRDVPPRQRSLRAVFEQTWQRLSQRERELFMAVSIFRGGFSREAAIVVAGASLAALRGLVNKSLLQSMSPERYQIHEMMRQFGAEKLSTLPDLAEDLRERHCTYFAARLHQQQAHLERNLHTQVLQEIETDLDNIRLAWQWATAHDQPHRQDQMLESLGAFFIERGRYAEGAADYGEAAGRLVAAAEAPATLVRFKIWQSHFAGHLKGEYSPTRFLEEALALLENPILAGQDMRRERATALTVLASFVIGSDRRTAKTYFQESLDLCRQIDYPLGAIKALGGLAWVARHTGDYDTVVHLMEEYTALSEKHGYTGRRSISVHLLGFTAMEQGEFAKAEKFFREDVAIYRQAENTPGLARSLRNLGVCLTLSGQFDLDHTQLEEARAIYTDLGDGSGLLFTTGWLGFARLHLGEYTQARTHAEEALRLAREVRHRGMTANNLLLLGSVELAAGDGVQAQAAFKECIAIYSQLNQRTEWATALATAAYAVRAAGDAAQARQLLAQALQVSTPKAFFPRAVAIPVLALLLVDQGDVERAMEASALANSVPYLARSRWFHDVAGRELAAIAASLPPAVTAAAQERGKALDLRAAADELLVRVNLFTQAQNDPHTTTGNSP